MKYIKNTFLGIVIMFIGVLAMNSPSVYAAVPANCAKSFFGIPVWYQYLNIDPATCTVLPGQANLPALVILGFIAIAVRLAGVLAVFMIIWGGYKLIFSDGSSDQVAGARKTILNAVIGLIIVILATPFVNFIAGRLSS